jgi:hypothetical protein
MQEFENGDVNFAWVADSGGKWQCVEKVIIKTAQKRPKASNTA